MVSLERIAMIGRFPSRFAQTLIHRPKEQGDEQAEKLFDQDDRGVSLPNGATNLTSNPLRQALLASGT
jgi:hypothetical protein